MSIWRAVTSPYIYTGTFHAQALSLFMEIYNKMNKLITDLLISASALSHSFFTPSAVASEAAWVFAHRVNSISALNAANNDMGINAIEIDITHRDDVPAKKTCTET